MSSGIEKTDEGENVSSDPNKMLHDLLEELAGYVTNMYVPAYEERMRFLFPQIRTLAPDDPFVHEIMAAAEAYLILAVNYYLRRTELGLHASETEANNDQELRDLAQSKVKATRSWSQLWQRYLQAHPTDKR